MDPKVLLLLPGLAACHTGQPSQEYRSLTESTTTINWPDDLNLPERREQQHPAHEDPSPMYRGLVYSNINVSNTAARSINIDSSVSASGSNAWGAMWPENNFILVSSVDELGVGGLLPPLLPSATARNVSPETTKHLSNPSTMNVHRSVTRRRG